MSRKPRWARDGVVGLLIALAPFAYKQATLGNGFVAGVTIVVMGLLVLAYRYADARVVEAVREADDAEDLKPVIRRVARKLRQLVKGNS